MIRGQVIPAPFRVPLLAFLFLLPLLHAARSFDRDTGFTSLILFGPAFDAQALDEVRNVPHPLVGEVGYDGQFYAQIAIDPALRHPQLKTALDNPRYRSVRILLPALAHALGLGRPAGILNAYALLNLAFFALLLWGFARFLKPRTIGHFLCIAAAAWSTGALASVARSLTDLPAATLAFWAAGLASSAAAFPIFAAAVLCRESTVIGLFSVAWPRRADRSEFLRAAAGGLAALLPIAAWTFYVAHVFGDAGTATPGSLGWPLVGLMAHLRSSCAALWNAPDRLSLFTLLSTLSLLAQAAYLGARPRLGSPFWRMGAAFAALFLFFSEPLFAEQLAYCRAVLPLTLAFNALLIANDDKHFFPWFIAGNAGMAFGALQMGWLLFRP
ncbi:MAG: hypothetical protein AB7V14_09955 [Kiritimatiellia bacterium]